MISLFFIFYFLFFLFFFLFSNNKKHVYDDNNAFKEFNYDDYMKQKILFGFMFFFLIGLVSASPFPHAFQGTVAYSDGALIQEDLTIIAKIDGEEIGNSKIINGKYDLITVSETGGTINFYVAGRSEIIKSYTFEAFEITELDLITNIPNPKRSSSSGSSSSSSSSSGGSSSSKESSIILITDQTQTINENTLDLTENQRITDSKISGGVIGSIKTGGIVIIIFAIILVALGIGMVAMKRKHKTFKNDE